MKDTDKITSLFEMTMAKEGIQKKNNSCIDFSTTEKAINKSTNSKLKSFKKKTKQDNYIYEDLDSEIHQVSDFTVEPVDAFEKVEFNLCSLSSKQKRNLQYNHTNYVLDLHGFSIKDARNALSIFIKDASKNNIKYVHIIHGRSTSLNGKKNTLKSLCTHWLKQMVEVIAFCSSKSKRNKNITTNFSALNVQLTSARH